MSYQISDLRTGTSFGIFGAAGDVSYVAATVTLTDDAGDVLATFGVSHRADDPAGVWAVDSLIRANGAVEWSHGAGDRSCAKRVMAADVCELLDRAAMGVTL